MKRIYLLPTLQGCWEKQSYMLGWQDRAENKSTNLEREVVAGLCLSFGITTYSVVLSQELSFLIC